MHPPRHRPPRGPRAPYPRALIALLWRAGLRISEAPAVSETDIDAARGSVLGRHGKGDKRRVLLSPGPLFCVIDGQTRGRRWAATAARGELRDLAAAAGSDAASRRTSCATPTRSSWREKWVVVNIIQRQLGHTDLGTTPTYLQGIDPLEIIDTVRARKAPTISMTAGLER